MHCYDSLLDESAQRHAIENVAELLPDLHIVSALALVVEAVETGDRGALVIAAEQKKVFFVLDLVRLAGSLPSQGGEADLSIGRARRRRR